MESGKWKIENEELKANCRGRRPRRLENATNTAMQNKSRRDRRPRRSVLSSVKHGIDFMGYLFRTVEDAGPYG